MSDKLVELFQEQKLLQRDTYGYDFQDMTQEERVKFLTWNALAMHGEVTEATQEFSWKPWASGTFIDRERLAGELVDVLKFWLNMALAIQVDPEELLQRFRGKTIVNKDRQDNGYTGRDKCACGRALDEPEVA